MDAERVDAVRRIEMQRRGTVPAYRRFTGIDSITILL